jgi:hypothetical protein
VLPLEIEVVNASPGITVVSPSKLAQRPGLANLEGAFEDQRLAGGVSFHRRSEHVHNSSLGKNDSFAFITLGEMSKLTD